MEASLIDHLSPEDQMKLAYVAWGALLLGLALWSGGVTFARGAVAVILGCALMVLGLWLPGKFGWAISPYIGGGVGFIIGALVGGWSFKWVQAATLAACLGLAVAGLYYQWHVRHPMPTTQVIMPREANSLFVMIKPAVAPSAYGAMETLINKIQHIPQMHLQRMAIAALGCAVAAILFAVGFPRATTILMTAVLGALALMGAVYCLAHVYSPRLSDHLTAGPTQTYLIMAVLAVIGLAIQYRFFLRKPDKSHESTTPAH